MSGAHTQRIGERLRDHTLLITGGSGFLGKTVLAACLRELEGLAGVRMLLRAADDASAMARLRDEVLACGAFTGLDRSICERALDSGWLTALAGDITVEQLGRATSAGLTDIDVVIHCAASVSFQQPLDEMLEVNVHGCVNLLRALHAAGSRPHFVHVSTAYAAGTRTGLVLERASGRGPAEPELDAQAELAAARAWRAGLEAESRLPEHQHRFVRDARQEIGPAGAPAIGTRAEAARRAWVSQELVQRGRERSRALGWADSYALSKALGERAVSAEKPQMLTIVRPTIIESALRTPFPGWLEGLKVADPVILAYASGMVRVFPGNPSARLDLVPVDLVANACIAAAAHPPATSPRVINVASGSRNPISVSEISAEVTAYFRERPLPDDDGLAIDVRPWRFITSESALRALDRGERQIRCARRLLDHVAIPRVDDAERRLHRQQRRLERLRLLTEIYGPYVELDCVFDDRRARELLAALHDDDRERFDFDVESIDWPTYLQEIHLPALRAFVRPSATQKPRSSRQTEAISPGPPALAIFDVEGVILDATVAHFYAWLRAREMPPVDRALWLTALTTRVPGYLLADRRSRTGFMRSFYHQYRGLPAAELRGQVDAILSEFILPRIRHAAVRRIRAHRARGDRVILVTGALDFLVDPLRHLGDELFAARLKEHRGSFTGELAEPPLTADGRASLVARLASEHDVDLDDCYAYGDSVSDLALLALVGHPVAVNPDFRLAREAHRRHWPVLQWEIEPGASNRPVAATRVPA